MNIAVEQVTAPGVLAEGPLWDARRQHLMWVDILGKTVHDYDPATGQDTPLVLDQETAALALVAGREEYLLAAGLDVGLLAWPSGERTKINSLARGVRANDGAVDPVGRYLIGTMVADGDPPGGGVLYSIMGGEVRPLLTGATISNGLDWSPDGTTMYYVDTPLERIDAFDYDISTGELADRRTFVDLADLPGRPDGLTVDADGCVWAAMARGGGAIRRFTPDGKPDLVIDLPVPNITSLAFGGPDLTDLYVTTSTLRMTPTDLARWPGAGAVFRVTGAAVTGREPHAFVP